MVPRITTIITIELSPEEATHVVDQVPDTATAPETFTALVSTLEYILLEPLVPEESLPFLLVILASVIA